MAVAGVVDDVVLTLVMVWFWRRYPWRILDRRSRTMSLSLTIAYLYIGALPWLAILFVKGV